MYQTQLCRRSLSRVCNSCALAPCLACMSYILYIFSNTCRLYTQFIAMIDTRHFIQRQSPPSVWLKRSHRNDAPCFRLCLFMQSRCKVLLPQTQRASNTLKLSPLPGFPPRRRPSYERQGRKGATSGSGGLGAGPQECKLRSISFAAATLLPITVKTCPKDE